MTIFQNPCKVQNVAQTMGQLNAALSQYIQRAPALGPAPDHPGCIEGSQEAPGTAGAHGPEGLGADTTEGYEWGDTREKEGSKLGTQLPSKNRTMTTDNNKASPLHVLLRAN